MPADEPPPDGLNTDGLDPDATERMIRVIVDADRSEIVSDRFWQLGVRAVTEIDLGDGSIEVTSSVGNDPEAVARAVASLDADWTVSVDHVRVGAADDWKRHVRPVRYRPDMVIVPAWLDVDAARRPGDIVTTVEPGSAFGLGDHPTTKGAMSLLADRLRSPGRQIGSVLDVGCGTGVLAVLAAQLGVATVRAIDVADAAVSATRHNARLNDVTGLVDVDTAPLDSIEGSFDVVVANILAPVLISLAAGLCRVTAPDGALIISGILQERHAHVLRALEPLRPVRSVAEDGWVTIELQRPQDGRANR